MPNYVGPKLWQRRDETVRATFEVKAQYITFMTSVGGQGPNASTDDSSAEYEMEDELPF